MTPRDRTDRESIKQRVGTLWRHVKNIILPEAPQVMGRNARRTYGLHPMSRPFRRKKDPSQVVWKAFFPWCKVSLGTLIKRSQFPLGAILEGSNILRRRLQGYTATRCYTTIVAKAKSTKFLYNIREDGAGCLVTVAIIVTSTVRAPRVPQQCVCLVAPFLNAYGPGRIAHKSIVSRRKLTQSCPHPRLDPKYTTHTNKNFKWRRSSGVSDEQEDRLRSSGAGGEHRGAERHSTMEAVAAPLPSEPRWPSSKRFPGANVSLIAPASHTRRC